eukprot:TRINITY_DN5500_c0_g1_i1.p1 TRINITY_DN5500_c0_g1~~TRINITY_DN5500_c0_g1_i1.p1  ORF type:complete len:208 (+),score=29.20 TRINITY_DN5500_c0_g1_i1:340-963(+)
MPRVLLELRSSPLVLEKPFCSGRNVARCHLTCFLEATSDLHKMMAAWFSFKFMKGNESSLQYLKTFSKQLAVGCELKHEFQLRKTISSMCLRWRSQDKMSVITGQYSSNFDCKVDVLRKLAPNASIAAEFEHKGDRGESNVRLGSLINYVGQSAVRVQVDPELKVRAMITAPVGRSALLQMMFGWDPKSRTFRQGIDIKMQGGVMLG